MATNLNFLEIAQQLFMKFGIRSVSMDDISKEAGISKKTAYNFVTNKAQLIDFVVERYIKMERKAIKGIQKEAVDALDEMIKITERIIFFLRNFKPSLTYDLKKYYKSSWDKVEKIHYEFIRQTIHENLIRGKNEGIYRKEIKELIVSKLYLELSQQIVNEDVYPIEDFSKVELFKNFIEYHLYGILNEHGLEKYKEYKGHDA